MENVLVKVWKDDEYLKITVVGPGKDYLKERAELKEEDTHFLVYGGKEINKVFKNLGLPDKEQLDAIRGTMVQGKLKASLVEEWAIERKEIREKRESIIKRIKKTERSLTRLFNKEEEYRKNAQEFVKSDKIPYMDGSTLLWLALILTLKHDFLKYHSHPERETISDYVEAREFIFNEDYEIDLDEPELIEKGEGVTVNLRRLLEECIENCKGKIIDAHVFDPSVESIRESIAIATGDPKLISKYKRRKNN